MTTKAGAIRYWKARRARYDFVRRRLKKILSLNTVGWPRMTNNPVYLEWLDIVYVAKEKGIYSWKTSNCDVIANIERKAQELQAARKYKSKKLNKKT